MSAGINLDKGDWVVWDNKHYQCIRVVSVSETNFKHNLDYFKLKTIDEYKKWKLEHPFRAIMV